MSDLFALLERLEREHTLPLESFEYLIAFRTPELVEEAKARAVRVRKAVYGNAVFTRGLIEISSWCGNDCYYCGLRRSNQHAERYRLTPEEILECCHEGWALGFRTFVLQGGEDPWFTDERLVSLLRTIKSDYPKCAVTLSLGERSTESYQRLFEAGADRYLLRHETADAEHYRTLHPQKLSWEHRIGCLRALKQIGYQVGCGFMVGSPGQAICHLAKDLRLVSDLQPAMCGIGPFIPHKDTPFAAEPAGSVELTCFLLSLLRLIKPKDRKSVV